VSSTAQIPGRSRTLITAAVMGGIFLAAMDVTAVAPAMPRIVGELGGGELFAWAFSIYALLSTTTTPVFGRLADRRGRKPVMLFGIAVFLIGSVASGAAPSMPFFLVARGIQGVGAGALMTTAFTIVGDLYDLRARARIQGYLSGVWGVASVVGPLVGGSLVMTVGWQWLFYMNVPIGLAAAALVHRHFRESGYPRPGAELDFLGGTFFSGAVLLMLAGLKLEGGAKAAALLAAAGSALVFVWRERSAREPLFDLTLFRIPVFRAANAAGLFAGAVLLSISAYLPVYVMNVRGDSPIVSGLMLTPLSLGWVTAATLSGRLLLRHSFRRIVTPGLALLVLTTLGLSQAGADLSYAIICGLMCIGGIGFGLSFTTFLVAVQEEVGKERLGQATSAVQFFRQIGGALGVAVLEVVYVSKLGAAELLEARPGQVYSELERSQLLDGFGAAFLLAAGLALLALLASVRVARGSPESAA
jgi:EmrB/QacA subfamily drug resistance transporter